MIFRIRRAPQVRRTLVAITLSVGLVTTAAACGEPEPPPPPPPPDVFVVYGDSLVGQVQPLLRQRLEQLLPTWTVVIRAEGGAAQCDLHGLMVDDAARLNVKGVLIAFSGNQFTPCIAGRNLRQGYIDDYLWAHDFWRNRMVAHAFVAATGGVGTFLDERMIGNLYRDLSSWFGVPVADVAPLFTQGSPPSFRRDMPCLVGEVLADGFSPCTDYVTVRDDIGGHICNTPRCTVIDPGAVRFVDPMIQTVAGMLGVPRPVPLVMRGLPPAPTTTTSTTSTTTTTSVPPTSSTTSTTSTTTTLP